MSKLSRKCLFDTNVPINANLTVDPGDIPVELTACVLACVEAVEHVTKKGGLVLDNGGEIFDEYRINLSMSGQPGVGDRFMKWVHDNQWNVQKVDRISITKNGESYEEFPDHAALTGFDNSDRKFVAVADAHPDNPPILQATDSKWWGWKDALEEVGITVQFLCSDYIKSKYQEKIDK